MNSYEPGGFGRGKLANGFLRGRRKVAQLLCAQSFGKLRRVGIDKRSEVAHRIGQQ
jgi:hypothetical protein